MSGSVDLYELVSRKLVPVQDEGQPCCSLTVGNDKGDVIVVDVSWWCCSSSCPGWRGGEGRVRGVMGCVVSESAWSETRGQPGNFCSKLFETVTGCLCTVRFPQINLCMPPFFGVSSSLWYMRYLSSYWGKTLMNNGDFPLLFVVTELYYIYRVYIIYV